MILETLDALIERLEAVVQEHGPKYASVHEGYGVLAEEVAELLDEIRHRDRVWRRIEEEALDVAVVAVKIAAMAREKTADMWRERVEELNFRETGTPQLLR